MQINTGFYFVLAEKKEGEDPEIAGASYKDLEILNFSRIFGKSGRKSVADLPLSGTAKSE